MFTFCLRRCSLLVLIFILLFVLYLLDRDSAYLMCIVFPICIVMWVIGFCCQHEHIYTLSVYLIIIIIMLLRQRVYKYCSYYCCPGFRLSSPSLPQQRPVRNYTSFLFYLHRTANSVFIVFFINIRLLLL